MPTIRQYCEQNGENDKVTIQENMTIKKQERQTNRKTAVICIFIVSLISILQYISLDLSINISAQAFWSRYLRTHLFNSGCTLLLTAVLTLMTGRIVFSCLISSVIFSMFSIANYYVYIYSGSPISLSVLSEIGTGMNVTSGYTFSLDWHVALILGILFLNIGLSILLQKQCSGKTSVWDKTRLRIVGLYCVCSLLICASITVYRRIHRSAVFPQNAYGYLGWAIEDSYFSYHTPLVKPNGYSAESVADIIGSHQDVVSPEEYPDIILILNETFFDLNQYVDLETDTPYLSNWYHIPNSATGYAASPYAAGGTNDSEFELLTSCPSYLITMRAPFTYMRLGKIYSIVQYMDALGYQTWAMHARDSNNYNRGNAWPALGFQHTKFYEDFSEHTAYGNREETDASNYRDLISWYESAGDEPRFFYLLTYQNHGGFEQNDDSFDTVHSLTDFGEDTSLVNEYLTSVQMSDDAIVELLSYFEDTDRPVLVCMVGDHAPSFITNWTSREDDSSDLAARKVPLMIWANTAFGTLGIDKLPDISMTDVLPTLLNTAGLPLSPYYAYLVNLAQDIPIRNRDGTYVTSNGETGVFTAADPNYKKLLPYYCASYANLAGDYEDMLPLIFAPPRRKMMDRSYERRYSDLQKNISQISFILIIGNFSSILKNKGNENGKSLTTSRRDITAIIVKNQRQKG